MTDLHKKWMEILKTFGSQYEWPYKYMHDQNRSPADQQEEAQAELLKEAIQALAQAAEEAGPKNQYPTDSITSGVRLTGFNAANKAWRQLFKDTGRME